MTSDRKRADGQMPRLTWLGAASPRLGMRPFCIALSMNDKRGAGTRAGWYAVMCGIEERRGAVISWGGERRPGLG